MHSHVIPRSAKAWYFILPSGRKYIKQGCTHLPIGIPVTSLKVWSILKWYSLFHRNLSAMLQSLWTVCHLNILHGMHCQIFKGMQCLDQLRFLEMVRTTRFPWMTPFAGPFRLTDSLERRLLKDTGRSRVLPPSIALSLSSEICNWMTEQRSLQGMDMDRMKILRILFHRIQIYLQIIFMNKFFCYCYGHRLFMSFKLWLVLLIPKECVQYTMRVNSIMT